MDNAMPVPCNVPLLLTPNTTEPKPVPPASEPDGSRVYMSPDTVTRERIYPTGSVLNYE